MTAKMSQQTKHLYEFAGFRLDGRERLLLREGEVVALTPKAFDLLLALVENGGHLLEKGDLMQRLWPDSFVEDGSLAQNVSLLRKALGESDNQKFIETVPRRGYRFVAGVRELHNPVKLILPEPSGPTSAVAAKQEPAPGEKVPEVEPGHQPARPAAGRRLSARFRQKPGYAGLTAALVFALVGGAIWYALTLNKPEPISTPAIKSIAVLPFKSLGADGSDEYLGLGIAETLTTRLSALKLLTVRPTNSVLKYAASEKETVVAGRELEVDTVLEGSIRRLGERVRVTARLVSVGDGSLLWADKFDESFTDIFKVEDSISAKVAEALALKLSGEEQRRLAKRYTDNTEAYQLYLKGRYFWNKRTEDGFNRGIAQFKQAVERDPNYALAYAGLADSYIGLTFYGFDAPNETMPRAKEAAMNALAIDHTLAEAHASLAHVLMNYDWNWPEAEREFKLSIELNPDYATAHQWYAIHYLTATGRPEEALQEMKRALELEPTSLVMNAFMGGALYFAGRYDEAIEQCRRTIEMDPNFAVAHWYAGLAYEQKRRYDDAISEFRKAIALSGNCPLMLAALGQAYAAANHRVEAVRILDELKERSTHRYVSSYEVAAIYCALGERERAFQLLESAYREHGFHLVYLTVWPQFAALRADPRFQDLVQRLGLAR
jgi:TolB-like protein/DNA-binding winged helix-turn-helix (wHTH) protein/Flp pilus assembly protein TadD